MTLVELLGFVILMQIGVTAWEQGRSHCELDGMPNKRLVSGSEAYLEPPYVSSFCNPLPI
jgi:hypothetical protein